MIYCDEFIFGGDTMRVDVLGVGFDSVTLGEAANTAFSAVCGDCCAGYVVTPNPEIVRICRDDPPFRDILNGAFLVLPDGIGVVYGAKLLGRPVSERVPGIDFISALFERMAKTQKSVFLFGAKPGVAELAAKNISAKYPGLVIAGTHNGYFSDDAPIIEEINSASPDLLLVCLGAPKQERWMAENAQRLNVRLMAGLGGSLDVFAGTVKRAPEGWQRLGLEWLYRLLREPRRITRMIKLPLFLVEVIFQRIRGH